MKIENLDINKITAAYEKFATDIDKISYKLNAPSKFLKRSKTKNLDQVKQDRFDKIQKEIKDIDKKIDKNKEIISSLDTIGDPLRDKRIELTNIKLSVNDSKEIEPEKMQTLISSINKAIENKVNLKDINIILSSNIAGEERMSVYKLDENSIKNLQSSTVADLTLINDKKEMLEIKVRRWKAATYETSSLNQTPQAKDAQQPSVPDNKQAPAIQNVKVNEPQKESAT